MPPETAVTVGTLSIRADPRDGPAHRRAEHRLAVTRLLEGADLRPPGMPPHAVLVVRRMRDPQPGRMAGSPRDLRVRSEWERLIRERLAEAYRGAARPAAGRVPERAEAVVFADESELLACLLVDVRSGSARQQWWWRVVLRSTLGARTSLSPAETIEALARHMVRRAHLVPAALRRLSERDQVLALLALSPGQAGHVLCVLLRAYRLPDLPGPAEMLPLAAPAPWQAGWPPGWLDHKPAAQLGRERAALLGLSLDLQDRPQETRTPAYHRRLHKWWQAAEVPNPGEAPWSTDRSRGTSESPGQRPGRSNPGLRPGDADVPLTGQPQPGPNDGEMLHADVGADTDSPPATIPEARNSSTDAPVAATPHLEPIDKPGAGAAGNRLEVPGHSQVSDQPPISTAPGRTHAAVPAEAMDDAPPPPPQEHVPERQHAAWLAGGVSTELGGVLYLINLMVFLELPGCFEAGWRLDSRVGAWGLLEALGRELARGAIAALDDDPLWVALAQLDGRAPAQPPGFRLPRSRPRRWPDFRLPDAWLEGLPDGTPQPGVRYKPRSSQHPPLLRRWLSLAVPFISGRLQLALGLPVGTALAEHLLHLPGRLYVSSSHVDLVASVEAISLPVRLAGLDRDPGWLPDFGRVVYFHFE